MKQHSKLKAINSALKVCGLPKPTLYQSRVFTTLTGGRDTVVETKNKTEIITISLLALLQTQYPVKTAPSVLILTHSQDFIREIEEKFQTLKNSNKYRTNIASLGSEGKAEKDLHIIRKNPSIIVGTTIRIIDHIRRNNINFSSVKKILIFLPDRNRSGFEQDLLFIISKLRKKSQFQVFVNSIDHLGNIDKILTRPMTLLYTNKESFDTIPAGESSMDTQKLEAKIESIVQEIKANPESLMEYRKIFKKKVPFFLRSYFAAKLLKDSEGSYNKSSKRTISGNMKTLFVSVGRRRRVHPGDLMKLFQKSLDIKSTQIGAIKVLDNYSFVDIEESLSKQAVEKMNGMDFRGRKISVDFAKKRN